MPAKASELAKVTRKLGFEQVRQKGSHARWKHPDGRATTIPIHGNATGSWLFYEILKVSCRSLSLECGFPYFLTG